MSAQNILARDPEEPALKLPEVPGERRRHLRKFKVYFTPEDLRVLEKVSAARGQQPSDFVRFATLKLFRELGVVGEERKRLLLLFTYEVLTMRRQHREATSLSDPELQLLEQVSKQYGWVKSTVLRVAFFELCERLGLVNPSEKPLAEALSKMTGNISTCVNRVLYLPLQKEDYAILEATAEA